MNPSQPTTLNRVAPLNRITSESDAWRREAERLYIQLHLHGEDSLTYFEIQRNRLYRWLSVMEERIMKEGRANRLLTIALTGKMQELRFQLSIANVKTIEALLQQQTAVHSRMDELQQYLAVARSKTTQEIVKIADEVESELIKYRTKFSLFRLRLKLADTGVKSTWIKKRRELSQKLRALHANLESEREEAIEALKRFYLELNS
jgi:hypothetical protein